MCSPSFLVLFIQNLIRRGRKSNMLSIILLVWKFTSSNILIMVLALVLFLVLDQTSGPIHSISPSTIPSNIPNGNFRLIPIPSIISSLRPSLYIWCCCCMRYYFYLLILILEFYVVMLYYYFFCLVQIIYSYS